MGNEMCKRFNRTLYDMLGTLKPDRKNPGRDTLDHLYMRLTVPDMTTGQSPFFLFFGREPRLPVDISSIGLNHTFPSISQYIRYF